MKRLVLALLLAAFVAGCGPTTKTEEMMFAWGTVLNAHLATGGGEIGDYAYPRKLDQVDKDLAGDMPREDAWGSRFIYRRIRDDLYQLISAGEDGEYGNEDDLVVENGVLKDPMEIYKKRPLKKTS